ncbi:hypothetical protein C0J52_23709 [Blattella germanica]|nr:hypothetical protein C0J52_23709 [Blattella germanica]
MNTIRHLTILTACIVLAQSNENEKRTSNFLTGQKKEEKLIRQARDAPTNNPDPLLRSQNFGAPAIRPPPIETFEGYSYDQPQNQLIYPERSYTPQSQYGLPGFSGENNLQYNNQRNIYNQQRYFSQPNNYHTQRNSFIPETYGLPQVNDFSYYNQQNNVYQQQREYAIPRNYRGNQQQTNFDYRPNIQYGLPYNNQLANNNRDSQQSLQRYQQYRPFVQYNQYPANVEFRFQSNLQRNVQQNFNTYQRGQQDYSQQYNQRQTYLPPQQFSGYRY